MSSNHKYDRAVHQLITTAFTRFMLILLVYTGLMVVAVVAGYIVINTMTWQAEDFLYRLLKFVQFHFLDALLITWVIGFAVVFFIYWRRMLRMVSNLAEASETLAADNDDLITLPSELQPIEERMNQVKQLSRNNARAAREAEQRKNELIVYLAHDLKTPLTSVIGYLTLLRDEQQISPELREKYLSISLEKAERLEDLINEFFEITRFNLSRMSLEISRVNLTRMLEQLSSEFLPLLMEKNIICQMELPPNLELRCDITKMERVFDNLFRNAINYSYPDSVLTIQAQVLNNGISVNFRNQGPTIAEDKLERLFEQFFRLDTSRSAQTGGAGLGLAIAKEIVTMHGGTIQAASRDEEIAVTLWLPSQLEENSQL